MDYGYTNAVINFTNNSGGSGDEISADNLIINGKDSVGDKVIVKRYSTQFLNYNELLLQYSNGNNMRYAISSFGIIGDNLLINAKYINSNRYQTLNVINNDLSINEIITLTYATTGDYVDYAYNLETTTTFMLGDWLFYKSNEKCCCYNLKTKQNRRFDKYIYMGSDNIFSTTEVSYGNDQNLYKFNEETGNMDFYCTVFSKVESYYLFFPLMFYNNYFLCIHDSQRYHKYNLKLYKIDPEQKIVTLLHNYGDFGGIFTYIYEYAPTIQLCPNYCLNIYNDTTTYCITIDTETENVKYNIVDTKSYLLRLFMYNNNNQTFSLLTKDDNDNLFLKILKFDKNDTSEIKIIKEYNLQPIVNKLNEKYNKTDYTYYIYGPISDNLDKIRIIFHSPSSNYSIKNILISLSDNLSDWCALSDDEFNYDSNSLTGIITQNNTNKVKVKTILPIELKLTINTDQDAIITVEGDKK